MKPDDFSRPTCAGVILSGGLNTRFNRENKALAAVGETKIIENTIDVFRSMFKEIIIVIDACDSKR